MVAAVSCAHSIRHHLAVLARRPTARITEFSRGRPTDWRPGQVRNPAGSLDGYFTDAAAWDLIASKLEGGHEVEAVRLRRPAGRIGYVMKIELEPDQPMLYVKVELGSGKIFGRSFHYSEVT